MKKLVLIGLVGALGMFSSSAFAQDGSSVAWACWYEEDMSPKWVPASCRSTSEEDAIEQVNDSASRSSDYVKMGS